MLYLMKTQFYIVAINAIGCHMFAEMDRKTGEIEFRRDRQDYPSNPKVGTRFDRKTAELVKSWNPGSEIFPV